MIIFFFALLLFVSSVSLKIWIPNTNINNTLNWDKKDIPKECDNIHFEPQIEIAVYWNLKKVVATGLSLPQTGDLIFPNNINIQFRNRENCHYSRDIKYIRHQVKGWLDPDNWKSDSEYQWLPHSERVPCAGESILFPPQSIFAVQLPSILVPIGEINFDREAFRGDSWSGFLKSDLGFQFFKGSDDVRNTPWRNDVGCFHDKKCICGRSSYTIRDRLYRDTEPFVFEEAVCLYAMPKCEPSACYSPVVPEGHCCGICGAVIKIEDKTKEGLNITALKGKVEEELEKQDLERKLKVYVGRTKDENIQIVVIAENPDDTIKSRILASAIKRKLIGDQKFQAKISSRVSGLRFSNYLFNSVSGVVFGTLMAVLVLFVFIYYIYLVLPKKKFQSSSAGNPFMFARFENTANEENLQIGVEPEGSEELPQAFDNPMFSRNTEHEKDCSKAGPTNLQLTENEILQTSESSSVKEYTNPVYSELEKTKKLDKFVEQPQDDEEEFSEIKF